MPHFPNLPVYLLSYSSLLLCLLFLWVKFLLLPKSALSTCRCFGPLPPGFPSCNHPFYLLPLQFLSLHCSVTMITGIPMERPLSCDPTSTSRRNFIYLLFLTATNSEYFQCHGLHSFFSHSFLQTITAGLLILPVVHII